MALDARTDDDATAEEMSLVQVLSGDLEGVRRDVALTVLSQMVVSMAIVMIEDEDNRDLRVFLRLHARLMQAVAGAPKEAVLETARQIVRSAQEPTH